MPSGALMRVGWFVTGTDTGVGKTHAAAALLRALSRRGISAVGMKPVASGCERTPQGLRNGDALALIAASGAPVLYDDVNPYAFEPAIAPHIAADLAGVRIEFDQIEAACDRLAADSRLVIVEGAGGWRVPLSETLGLSDLAARLGLGVILVVGLRLGCLNHALLTAEAIEADRGPPLVGWIGNQLDEPMPQVEANLATLRARIAAPCLGMIPFDPAIDPDRVAERLDLAPLLATIARG